MSLERLCSDSTEITTATPTERCFAVGDMCVLERWGCSAHACRSVVHCTGRIKIVGMAVLASWQQVTSCEDKGGARGCQDSAAVSVISLSRLLSRCVWSFGLTLPNEMTSQMHAAPILEL